MSQILILPLLHITIIPIKLCNMKILSKVNTAEKVDMRATKLKYFPMIIPEKAFIFNKIEANLYQEIHMEAHLQAVKKKAFKLPSHYLKKYQVCTAIKISAVPLSQHQTELQIIKKIIKKL